MPRGQDPGTVTGGALSPYVQKSLQTGKQQSENRLLGALGEAGATSRTRMQEQGAMDRTAMQISAENTQQAARLEADDRRAAEAEVGRREDKKFRKLMEEERQGFEVELSKINEEFAMARESRDIGREDEAIKRAEAAQAVQDRIDAATARQTNKVTVAMARMGLNNETAKQKLQTTIAEGAEETEKRIKNYEQARDDVSKAALVDKRMDIPLKGPKMREVGFNEKALLLLNLKRTPNKPLLEPGTTPDPMGILQTQLRGSGSSVEVADLNPDNPHALIQKITSGELKMMDIQAAASSLEGMILALETKGDGATTKAETEFWHKQLNDMKRKRLGLNSLMQDKTKVGQEGVEIVGSIVRDALSPGSKTTIGSQIALSKEAYEDFNAATERHLTEMEKAMDIPGLIPTFEDDDEYITAIVNRRNQARQSAFPDEGGF